MAAKITIKGEDIGKPENLKSILESFGIDKEVVHVLYVEKLLKFAKNEVIPPIELQYLISLVKIYVYHW